ncbi:protein of unknown function [Algoriphagus alkaliphilus]|uniref:DUF4345 domain-containing protein n=1 Tax=Algoriphagus alkaliphilus TaxID=279824 RepID=A0A1G5ZA99_9BACT|nr:MULTISPECIES: DUF4345 domain-containing protein [Algoriphagus]MDP2042925.1 DUF4345 domain-containing protein [Algoriphagus sp.]MDP3473422.1 DUF4345 domain-containing protein [Algoriphagus sp.]SDA91908.1 protein of unknown function [Algoriphagus alkaliphilus]
MKNVTKWVIVTRIYLGFSILSLLSVSVMALFDPQSVMDLVGVSLNNTDALSSIRGVYGGVGLTICLSILYLLIKHPEKGAGFLSIFWGAYAFSRLITLISDGPLGDFGNQWLMIESIMALIGLGLWIQLNSSRRKQKFVLQHKF